MTGAQCAYRIVFAVIFVAAISVARAQQPQQPFVVVPEGTTIALTVGGAPRTIMVTRPFKSVQIVDAKVVDAIALSDRDITFVAKAAGSTPVQISDDNGVIANLNVVVTEKAREVARERFDGVPGRVRIHNQAALGSFTIYSCTPTNCEHVEELIMKKPPPPLAATSEPPGTHHTP